MAQMIRRTYSGFRGADFRGEECSLNRSPDCLNLWRDYRQEDSVRTRPALERKAAFDETVWGVFFFRDTLLVHSGTKLYEVREETGRLLYSGLQPRESRGFLYNNVWYFLDGKQYLCYDGGAVREVEGYVPTTSIGRRPSGGGTAHEDVNLLTGLRINTFLADGESTDFYLDARELDTDYAPVVTVNGEEAECTVDYEGGRITFGAAPEAPLTDGQDNVSVRFRKTVPGYRQRIEGCTLVQVFDNRVFFSGNPDYPNTLWHCALEDPAYCSDLDYYREGMDPAAIRGLVAGNNALWVFREPSRTNTTVFYHIPTLDADYGKIYPSQHSSITTGCLGRAVNFNDDIVFFSDRGMEGISGDITTEQAIAHRSSLVDSRLTAEAAYNDMILLEWEGYLLVCIGNRVYLADSRRVFSNLDHREYDWFYWELSKTVTCAAVDRGILYLGTGDGVYTLTDNRGPLESHWVTPKDKFRAPNQHKTTNKRGCLIEASGDVAVYAKTEDSDFTEAGSGTGITDHLVVRLKRKKFKDLQLKFRSDTRFRLESAVVECFVGGYIKG